MTRHGADTVEDDYLDESNLQNFSFTSHPKCCKKCYCQEPLCHECCGKYQFERDMAIRKNEREKVLNDLLRWIPENAVSYDYGYYEPAIDAEELKKKILILKQKGRMKT